MLLAVALAVHAVRHGSVCVDLGNGNRVGPRARVAGPERLDVGRPGLAARGDRGDPRGARPALPRPLPPASRPRSAPSWWPATRSHCRPWTNTALSSALERVRGRHFSAEQEAASVGAVRRWTTVLTGGPGTGKTTRVARLLALLADQAGPRTGRSRSRSPHPPARPPPGCRRRCSPSSTACPTTTARWLAGPTR